MKNPFHLLFILNVTHSCNNLHVKKIKFYCSFICILVYTYKIIYPLFFMHHLVVKYSFNDCRQNVVLSSVRIIHFLLYTYKTIYLLFFHHLVVKYSFNDCIKRCGPYHPFFCFCRMNLCTCLWLNRHRLSLSTQIYYRLQFILFFINIFIFSFSFVRCHG